ncbi:hypothetical protein ABUE34_12750 [Kozakia baliensis]|uniref:hypothetical protein n=1 Tax=Kozakia baliensis TaxID=153496 RepID=UPI00345BDAFD
MKRYLPIIALLCVTPTHAQSLTQPPSLRPAAPSPLPNTQSQMNDFRMQREQQKIDQQRQMQQFQRSQLPQQQNQRNPAEQQLLDDQKMQDYRRQDRANERRCSPGAKC